MAIDGNSLIKDIPRDWQRSIYPDGPWSLSVEVAFPPFNDDATPSPQWLPLTNVTGIRISAGSDEPHGMPTTGEMVITLNDPDDWWNPFVSESPYAEFYETGALVRVAAVKTDFDIATPSLVWWTPKFTGLVESWTPYTDAVGRVKWVEIVVTDTMSALAGIDKRELDTPVGAGETAAAREIRLLEDADWQYDFYDELDSATPVTSTTMAGNRLGEAKLTAASVDGYFSAHPSGVAILSPADARLNPQYQPPLAPHRYGTARYGTAVYNNELFDLWPTARIHSVYYAGTILSPTNTGIEQYYPMVPEWSDPFDEIDYSEDFNLIEGETITSKWDYEEVEIDMMTFDFHFTGELRDGLTLEDGRLQIKPIDDDELKVSAKDTENFSQRTVVWEMDTDVGDPIIDIGAYLLGEQWDFDWDVVGGGYATLPDPGNLDGSGTQIFKMRIQAFDFDYLDGDLDGAYEHTIVFQQGASGNRSWELRYSYDGPGWEFGFDRWTGSSSANSYSCPAPDPTPGEWQWFAVVMDWVADLMSVYTSVDGVQWTLFDSNFASGPVTFVDSSAPITIGRHGFWTTGPSVPKMSYLSLQTGSNPNTPTGDVWTFDATDTDGWTISDPDALVTEYSTELPPVPVYSNPYLDGTLGYATIPDPAYGFTNASEFMFRMKIQMPAIPNGSFDQVNIVQQYGAAAGGRSYIMYYLPDDNGIVITIFSNTGTPAASMFFSVSPDFTPNTWLHLAMTIDYNSAANETWKLWTSSDGVTWTETYSNTGSRVTFNNVSTGTVVTVAPSTATYDLPKVAWMEMRNGLNPNSPGSIVWRFDAADTTGWTLTHPAVIQYETTWEDEPVGVFETQLRLEDIYYEPLARFTLEQDASGSFIICDGEDQTPSSPITYDPVAHRWFRIDERYGDFIFSTSPDGETWTVRYTINDHGKNVSSMVPTMLAQYSGGDYGNIWSSYIYSVNYPDTIGEQPILNERGKGIVSLIYDADTLVVANDRDVLVNEVRFARVEGEQQVAQDLTSIARRGVQSYTRNDLVTQSSDDVLDIAEAVLARRSTLTKRVVSVQVTNRPENMPAMLSLHVGDLVTVEYRDGISFEAAIAAVEHNITPGNESQVNWTATYTFDTYPEGS